MTTDACFGQPGRGLGAERNPLEFLGPDIPPFFIARGVLDSYSSGTSFIEVAETERDPDQQRIVRLAFRFLTEHLADR